MLPKLRLNSFLDDLEQKVLLREASEKLDSEMRLQINEASGKSSTQIRDEALDEFGKLEEFKAMDDIIGGMLVKAAENKAETQKFTEIR